MSVFSMRSIPTFLVATLGACTATSSAPVNMDATRLPAIFTNHGVYLHATINGVTLLMQLDTGSPLARLDPNVAVFKGVVDAGQVADPNAPPLNLDVQLGDRDLGPRAVKFQIISGLGTSYPDLPDEPIAGLIGNSVFENEVLGVNPRDNELWISDPPAADTPVPSPVQTGAPQVVSMQRPLGYLQVPCAFADAPAKGCLFDTGSPDSLVLERYWNQLAPHPSDRIVPYEFGDYQGQVYDGYYQRATAARIGDTVRVPGEYALVGAFDSFDKFCTTQLSPDCVGIVGMHAVVGYHTIIDYANAEILYFPYEPPHAAPDPFVGFALLFDGTTTGLVVHAVVPGSDAESAGIAPADVLTEIDGQPLLPASFSWAVPGYIAGSPGEARRFGFSRAGTSISITLTAADLLPPLGM